MPIFCSFWVRFKQSQAWVLIFSFRALETSIFRLPQCARISLPRSVLYQYYNYYRIHRWKIRGSRGRQYRWRRRVRQHTCKKSMHRGSMILPAHGYRSFLCASGTGTHIMTTSGRSAGRNHRRKPLNKTYFLPIPH